MHDSYSHPHEDEHLRFGLSEAERLYQHRFSAFLFENESGPQLPGPRKTRPGPQNAATRVQNSWPRKTDPRRRI